MATESKSELLESELVLEVDDDIDNIAAPPEDLSDEEIFDKTNKVIPYKKINENNSAGRLQMRVPDAPDNLIELVYRKKCVECNAILTTISSALMHYNSVKHQNKIALKFLPHGTYNLPLSKEEIREIETGVSKTGESAAPGVAPPKTTKIPFRELVKKFEIKENIQQLNLEYCRVCDSPFPSKIKALQHYSSKRHKEISENSSKTLNQTKPINTKDELHCDVCNIAGGSSTDMESHFKGRKHIIRMKTYLDGVNCGNIVPPMSARGFCDFNNVDRDALNPVDALKYLPNSYKSTSFRGNFNSEETIFPPNNFVGSVYGVQQSRGFGFDTNSDNTSFSIDSGIRGPVSARLGFDSGISGSVVSRLGFSTGLGRSVNTGYGSEFGMNITVNNAMESNFRTNSKPDPQLNYMTSNFNQPESKRNSGGIYDGSYGMIAQNNMQLLSADNTSSRSQASGFYTPNLANRLGSKVPVQTFGPTKFKYNRKQKYQ